MRQIDEDKISRLGLTIAISERTGDVLKGHARGKEEVIRRAIDVFNQVLLQAPTVDQWHYPSRGEYPTEGEKVLIFYENDGVLDTCLGDYSYCEPAEDESFKADFYWNKENLDPLDDRQVKCWQYIIPPKEKA